MVAGQPGLALQKPDRFHAANDQERSRNKVFLGLLQLAGCKKPFYFIN
jgi:hypothetical protein